jgi:AcrR family transcriptional regulator
MRRASTQLQSDRRAEILDAAQRCFVRAGFHRTSMHEICAEAAMSPGNLYRYFPSKEAIIAGIAERDRAEVAQRFASEGFSTDFFGSFAALARHYFVERGDEEIRLCTEIMAESRRNAEIARISESFDVDIKARLIAVLKDAAARGDIAEDIDFEGVITMLMLIADGIFWRRALDPSFDAETIIPLLMDITRHMLRGRPAAVAAGEGTTS